MSKIIYVGANGMLGRDFMAAASARDVEALGIDLPEIDITDFKSLESSLPECDVVINGAAYTRVDDAEKEIDIARKINAGGAGNVAKICQQRGIKLIQISTDYVFNGKKDGKYVETDETDPISMYGRTKLEGEEFVLGAAPSAIIARTQSLYGIHGRNFVKAILGQVIKGKKELTVVSDQVSAPTYTKHLAEALLNLADTDQSGIVHVASRGGCSWHEFACKIMKQAGIETIDVKPMSALELNYPAPRPPYSVLSTERYAQWTGQQMQTWQEGLAGYMEEEELVAQAVATT